MQRRADRIPSLDGLRAVSIVLVIVSHCFLHAHAHSGVQKGLLALVSNGSVGVSVFFVISGFLITLLLVREKERFGRISLREFYVRRAFRILPAFLVYLSVIACLAGLGFIVVERSQFLWALTFTMDYAKQRNWYVGHVWSLSVEEQFYLVWPVLVAMCSFRTLSRIAGAIVVLGPLIRMADRVLFPSTKFDIEYMAHTRVDMLMFGCLLAFAYRNDDLRVRLLRLNTAATAVASGVFLLVLSPAIELRFAGVYLKTVGYTLQGLCISILLLYVVTRPASAFGRLLNHPAVAHIGVLSYSLYLWQELFLAGQTFRGGRVLVGSLCAVLAAEASYYLVERPMLRIKRRFEHRALQRPEPLLPLVNEASSGLESLV